MTTERSRPPAGTRHRLDSRRLGNAALVYVALAGLGVAQPLLDLYGRNPEALVAADLSRIEIVGFVLVAILAVPVLALLLEVAATLVSPRAGRVAHLVLVAGLAGVLVLGWTAQLGLEAAPLVLAVAAGGGVAVAVAEVRSETARRMLHLLALAPVAFAGLFLWGSGASKLMAEAEAVPEGSVRFSEPERPPVVWLVLDEFPVSTLMDRNGEIDAERFPGFARLAGDAHWFRNATSPAYLTQFAVPAMLTSHTPEGGRLPILADHPENLFTLLGREYKVWAYEVFTELCPGDVCGETAGPSTASSRGLTHFLADAWVAYRAEVLPPPWRDNLPRLDQGWGGYLDIETDAPQAPETTSGSVGSGDPDGSGDDSSGSSGEERRADQRWREVGDGRRAPNQAAILASLGDALSNPAEGHLWFAHVALPHAPWILTPLGHQNTVSAPEIDETTMDEARLAWETRQLRQRHLLQVGALDAVIAGLIDQMEDLGIWEEALVVVTSDHGVSLLPPDVGRTPTERNGPEVFRVPLFVKLPGQGQGEVHDESASTLDLLPTLMDALGIRTDWALMGRSLLDPAPEEPGEIRVMSDGKSPRTIPSDLDGYLETVVAAHADDFPRGGWLGVAAVGEFGALVGTPQGDLAASGTEDGSAGAGWSVHLDQAEAFESIDLTAGLVPLRVTGTLRLPPGVEAPPEEVLVVLNGTVAGVGGGWSVAEGGGFSFSALLADELFVEGRNRWQVLVPDPAGAPGSFLAVSQE